MTELELREAIKAMIDRSAAEQLAAERGKPLIAAIDATHNARKRHPIEWPEDRS